jgi:hypothetical protein
MPPSQGNSASVAGLPVLAALGLHDNTPLEKALGYFVTESNRIEGINRKPLKTELSAHAGLLALDELSVGQLEDFVRVVAGRPLRRWPGYDVRVGNHIPPPGGPHIEEALVALLGRANAGADPFRVHVEYETLHPFMDGNGRSGRAVWLWQMLRQFRAPHALRMGFLHLFYYQTLSARSALSSDPGDGVSPMKRHALEAPDDL